MFMDWVHHEITQEYSVFAARLVAAFLAESAAQSSPWQPNSRLALPPTWNQPRFWQWHVCGASTDPTKTYSKTKSRERSNAFFFFNIFDNISVQMPLHAVAQLVDKET